MGDGFLAVLFCWSQTPAFCSIAATCARVAELGGEVLTDTDLGGFAVTIRDPDGQVIELLPMTYRDTLA